MNSSQPPPPGRTVGEAGERALLRWLRGRIPVGPGVLIGPGDDAALLRTAAETVVTTDTLVGNVHFRREWSTPRRLGRKALSVNLSDVAAMAGRSRYVAVNGNVGDPDSGPCGSWLQITGSGGFSTTRNGIAGDGYHGYTHIVDFFASSGEYTATAYRNWSDTSIEARIWNLFRDGGGGSPPYGQPDKCSIDPITGQRRVARSFVQDPAGKEDCCDSGAGNQGCEAEPTIPRCDCLSTGVYNVYEKAIYYGDDDASGNLSCGDTIFEVEKRLQENQTSRATGSDRRSSGISATPRRGG